MSSEIGEVSVSVSQRRWACVLDPTLALSAYGLAILSHLGRAMELWVGRELWHILDNTHFYYESPDSLFPQRSEQRGHTDEKSHLLLDTLREWEQLRLERDPARQNCFWIGDGPMESFLPDELHPEIVWRFEAISAALDRRMADVGPLPSAYRDTAALAVCLPSAFVLTHLEDSTAPSHAPGICQALGEWGVVCRAVADDDPWRKRESEMLYRALVVAGMGKWVWSGLRPAVLHLACPAALKTVGADRHVSTLLDDDFIDLEPEASRTCERDYWRNATAYWYPL